MSNDIDIKPLEELLETYKYGKHHLKSGEIEVIYNPKTDKLHITNFYAFGEYLRNGTCVELMNTSCMEMKMMYPEYHILRAMGHEPRYFFQDTATHFFNIISEEQITDKLLIHNKKELRKLLKRHDPWIVDPSLKYIQKYSESRYVIDAIYNESFPQKNSNTATLQITACVENCIPIGITSQDQLVYISMSPKYDETFMVTIQDINRFVKEKNIPIQDKQIYRHITCKETLGIIEILKSKEKKVSVRPVESREEVFYG